MKDTESGNKSRDMLSSPHAALAVFWLPAAALAASGSLQIEPLWRTAIWTLCLATMGTGCVLNALRCGRTHCYFTGPFLLLMAVVTVLFGLGVAPLGKFGWSIISVTVVLGSFLLCCVPEALFGPYRRGRGTRA